MKRATSIEKPSYEFRVVFSKDESGTEPVRTWLTDLAPDICVRIASDLMGIQRGTYPYFVYDKGLWYVATSLPGNKEAQVFFGAKRNTLVALHGCIGVSNGRPLPVHAIVTTQLDGFKAQKIRIGSRFDDFLRDMEMTDKVQATIAITSPAFGA